MFYLFIYLSIYLNFNIMLQHMRTSAGNFWNNVHAKMGTWTKCRANDPPFDKINKIGPMLDKRF